MQDQLFITHGGGDMEVVNNINVNSTYQGQGSSQVAATNSTAPVQADVKVEEKSSERPAGCSIRRRSNNRRCNL